MRLCANAERRGDLSASGDIFASDSLLMPDCVDSVMLAFGKVPVAQRAFSTPDFTLFATAYCKEAVRQDLLRAASSGDQAALMALRTKVLNELEKSGKIKRIR